MRVLVACEYSNRVRDAFRARGHNAWSCDLEPADGDPEFHWQGDVLRLLRRTEWDLLIAHPPCTYLTNAGARWFKDPSRPKDELACREYPHPQYPDRWQQRDDAIRFFLKLQSAGVKKVCIENSQPSRYAMSYVGQYTQRVQPWMFGENFTKGACLWLEGLDPLVATHSASDYDSPPIAKCHSEAPGKDRWKRRSVTYQSIADAMAEQWG